MTLKHILHSCVYVFASHMAGAQEKNFIDEPYIEVAGIADTLVLPDEIYVRIVLSEEDTRDRRSLERLEQKMIAALKSLAINTSSQLSVADAFTNFNRRFFGKGGVLKTKSFMLKLSSEDQLARVMLALEAEQIANVQVLETKHSKMKEITEIMKVRAMQNAKKVAAEMAKSINQNVSSALLIEENANAPTAVNFEARQSSGSRATRKWWCGWHLVVCRSIGRLCSPMSLRCLKLSW
jgi:uncharacterized protein